MNTTIRRLRPVAVLTAGLLIHATTQAQWPHQVDVDLLVSGTGITASAPAIDADGAGGVFAAWNDNRNLATNDQDLFAQHYNADGIASWPEGGVPVCTAANRQDNAIAVNAGSGRVFIVWDDERDSTSHPRIYAQLLGPNGAPQWAENGIRVGPNEFNQTDVLAVSDGDGNLLVAWTETNNNFRTFVQKIDPTGAPLWSATGFEFSSGVFGGAAVHTVVPDGAGGAVVGWVQFGESPRTVWARRILANGTAAFDAVGFGNDVSALGTSIAMAPDSTGGAFIGWQVDNGTDDNLYIQRVDGDGNLPWGTDSIQLVDAVKVQDKLQIVADTSGGAFLSWEDPRTDVDNIYIQHVTSIGSFSLDENGMPVGTSTAQRQSGQMIADGAGGAIVSFHYSQEGTWIQRIGSDGTRMWGNNGSPLTDNGTINFPTLTSDGSNGAIFGALAFTNGNRAALKRILGSGDLPTSRLINISTRAFVGTGESQAIPGFVIGGSGTKNLLIRGVGPKLADFGVSGVLDDPILTLYDSMSQVLDSRDNWDTESDAAEIISTSATVGAFALDAGSNDSALLESLAPGSYTAGVTGAGATTGNGLLEVYDASYATDTSQITNLSSRVFVGTGDSQAIPGFVIKGPATMTLLIRAVGPTLGSFGVGGVLEDPILTLYDSDSAVITSNDDWGDVGSTQANGVIAAAATVGAFPLETNSLDSTLLITLAPGRYTAGVIGADAGTGICLVELYVVP